MTYAFHPPPSVPTDRTDESREQYYQDFRAWWRAPVKFSEKATLGSQRERFEESKSWPMTEEIL